MVAEDELRELGHRLRVLAESSPVERSGLDSWYARAGDLERHLRENAPPVGSILHFIYHYLADADIRVKDELYRADQQAQIFSIISSLDRGELPPGAA